MVGIFLPPSVPGALVNYAALLCGKVPVNLNYTLSEATLASCVKQCDLKTVITSRTFLEKVKLTLPCETIFLEDLAGGAELCESAISGVAALRAPNLLEKLTAWLMAKFLPVGLLERALSSNPTIENRQSAIPGRSGHRDFFQRQHRRAERRDAHALQHRLEHRAVRTGL